MITVKEKSEMFERDLAIQAQRDKDFLTRELKRLSCSKCPETVAEKEAETDIDDESPLCAECYDKTRKAND